MDINLTGYLLTLGCSAAACILWFFLSWRRQPQPNKAAALSGLIFVLGTVLGILCARLAWMLIRINALRLPQDLLTLRYDRMSFLGGAAGVILAVFLSAKITGQPAKQVLNAFAPMGALLMAGARFAEGFLGTYGVGFVEEWYESGVFFPVTIGIAWDEYNYEYYLAVFMFSGIFCLIASALSLVHRKEDNRLVRTLFYICLPQVLLESLRLEILSWLFVNVEQLACFLFCEGVLVARAVRAGAGKLRSWIRAIGGLLVCGIVIAGMFALDGKITFGGSFIPKAVTYGVMALALAGMAVAEHISNKHIAK